MCGAVDITLFCDSPPHYGEGSKHCERGVVRVVVAVAAAVGVKIRHGNHSIMMLAQVISLIKPTSAVGIIDLFTTFLHVVRCLCYINILGNVGSAPNLGLDTLQWKQDWWSGEKMGKDGGRRRRACVTTGNLPLIWSNMATNWLEYPTE